VKKLTINEAADKLGITKEAIYNRIRRGSVKTIVENGEKYVVFDSEEKVPASKQEKSEKPFAAKPAADINFSIQYMNLLISQIDDLKKTNQELNKDRDRLIKEKENLLIEQRDMVERIYKERDEQLKIMLTLTNRTLLANPNTLQNTTIEAQLENRVKSEQETSEDSDWFRLKTVLKEKGYSKKKKKKILSNVKDFLGVDENIVENDGEIYIKGSADFKEIIKD